MPYIPHTQKDTTEMLKVIGVSKIEDLFEAVPQEVMKKAKFDLPPGLSEQETSQKISTIAQRNQNPEASFLGGGVYHHYIPAPVPHLANRSEFVTAYTPYQPEISQGILQAIFEYQTMITRLTAMDATNASMYDGSSATGEVCLMASNITRRNKILVAQNVHPQYREVMQTYCNAKDLTLEEVPFDMTTGQIDQAKLSAQLSEEVAGIFIQSPNFFGVVEEMNKISAIAHEKDALSVQIITEALSLGLLKPPGEYGADIVVGEGQSFGNSLSLGGPYWGFMTANENNIRKMPGRIFGLTEDEQGRDSYALILGPREQHIKRERATSNICSNQWLCLAISTAYLLSQGEQGLKETARQNILKAHHAFDKICEIDGYEPTFPGRQFFNEFAVRGPQTPIEVNRALAEQGILGGLDLGRYSKQEGSSLYCVTEARSAEHIGKLVEGLKNA